MLHCTWITSAIANSARLWMQVVVIHQRNLKRSATTTSIIIIAGYLKCLYFLWLILNGRRVEKNRVRCCYHQPSSWIVLRIMKSISVIRIIDSIVPSMVINCCSGEGWRFSSTSLARVSVNHASWSLVLSERGMIRCFSSHHRIRLNSLIINAMISTIGLLIALKSLTMRMSCVSNVIRCSRPSKGIALRYIIELDTLKGRE